MGEKFPFFYYDIVARIIPAGAFLLALQKLGLSALNWIRPALLESGVISKEKESALLEPAAIAIVFLGAIGVFFEAIPYALRVRGWLDRCMASAFEHALLKKETWRREMVGENYIHEARARELAGRGGNALSRYAWNWLMHQHRDGCPKAFTVAHRFQAESKMFQHLAIGAYAVTILFPLRWAYRAFWDTSLPSDVTRDWWYLFIGAFGIFSCCLHMTWTREVRRWMYVIDTVEELQDEKDESNLLRGACGILHQELSQPAEQNQFNRTGVHPVRIDILPEGLFLILPWLLCLFVLGWEGIRFMLVS